MIINTAICVKYNYFCDDDNIDDVMMQQKFWNFSSRRNVGIAVNDIMYYILVVFCINSGQFTLIVATKSTRTIIYINLKVDQNKIITMFLGMYYEHIWFHFTTLKTRTDVISKNDETCLYSHTRFQGPVSLRLKMSYL